RPGVSDDSLRWQDPRLRFPRRVQVGQAADWRAGTVRDSRHYGHLALASWVMEESRSPRTSVFWFCAGQRRGFGPRANTTPGGLAGEGSKQSSEHFADYSRRGQGAVWGYLAPLWTTCPMFSAT